MSGKQIFVIILVVLVLLILGGSSSEIILLVGAIVSYSIMKKKLLANTGIESIKGIRSTLIVPILQILFAVAIYHEASSVLVSVSKINSLHDVSTYTPYLGEIGEIINLANQYGLLPGIDYSQEEIEFIKVAMTLNKLATILPVIMIALAFAELYGIFRLDKFTKKHLLIFNGGISIALVIYGVYGGIYVQKYVAVIHHFISSVNNNINLLSFTIMFLVLSVMFYLLYARALKKLFDYPRNEHLDAVSNPRTIESGMIEGAEVVDSSEVEIEGSKASDSADATVEGQMVAGSADATIEGQMVAGSADATIEGQKASGSADAAVEGQKVPDSADATIEGQMVAGSADATIEGQKASGSADATIKMENAEVPKIGKNKKNLLIRFLLLYGLGVLVLIGVVVLLKNNHESTPIVNTQADDQPQEQQDNTVLSTTDVYEQKSNAIVQDLMSEYGDRLNVVSKYPTSNRYCVFTVDSYDRTSTDLLLVYDLNDDVLRQFDSRSLQPSNVNNEFLTSYSVFMGKPVDSDKVFILQSDGSQTKYLLVLDLQSWKVAELCSGDNISKNENSIVVNKILSNTEDLGSQNRLIMADIYYDLRGNLSAPPYTGEPYELTGLIDDRYQVTMKLLIQDNKIYGTYYYDNKGSDNYLYLYGGISESGEAVLLEFNKDGLQTSNFRGVFSGGSFYGTFTNYMHDEMFFRLQLN